MNTYQILLAFHIACTAVWFGGSLSTPGRIRRGLAASESEAKWMAAETNRSINLSLIFGILTLVSGLILIFKLGGFAAVPHRIHMGLGITILMLILEGVLFRQAWKQLHQIILSGSDRTGIKGPRVRLAIASGIQQLLWLIVLLLMVVKS